MHSAKLPCDEELSALKRLDNQARMLELIAEGPSLEHHIAQERLASPDLGGRSVFGWEKERAIKKVAGMPPILTTLPSPTGRCMQS